MIHPRSFGPRPPFGLLFGLLLGLLLAASGCEKANDVPRLQAEARTVAQSYQERFTELSRRAEEISKRGNTLRADAASSADAQRAYGEAVRILEDGRRTLQGVPKQIEAGATGDDPDALAKLIDSLRERLGHAVIEVNASLDAVESWIGIAEQQQGRAAPAPDAQSGQDAASGTVPAGAPQPTGAEATVR